MEGYNAWIFLQDKWPLALAVAGVIITIFIVQQVGERNRKKAEKEEQEKSCSTKIST